MSVVLWTKWIWIYRPIIIPFVICSLRTREEDFFRKISDFIASINKVDHMDLRPEMVVNQQYWRNICSSLFLCMHLVNIMVNVIQCMRSQPFSKQLACMIWQVIFDIIKHAHMIPNHHAILIINKKTNKNMIIILKQNLSNEYPRWTPKQSQIGCVSLVTYVTPWFHESWVPVVFYSAFSSLLNAKHLFCTKLSMKYDKYLFLHDISV